MSTRRLLEWVLLASSSLPVAAADNAAAERERIARERAHVEAKARAGEAACAREFAVSACTKGVRTERRAALQQLDRQRALLDDAQRKQRAAERLARIRQRQDAAARAVEKPSVEVKSRQKAAPAAERTAQEIRAEESAREQRSQAAKSTLQLEDAKAARRAAAARERERQAAAHREQAEQRRREREMKKPPSAGLPVPPASAPTR
jgi:colicin import membrane protein